MSDALCVMEITTPLDIPDCDSRRGVWIRSLIVLPVKLSSRLAIVSVFLNFKMIILGGQVCNLGSCRRQEPVLSKLAFSSDSDKSLESGMSVPGPSTSGESSFYSLYCQPRLKARRAAKAAI